MPKVLILKAPRRHVCNHFWRFFSRHFWLKNITSRDGCVLLIKHELTPDSPVLAVVARMFEAWACKKTRALKKPVAKKPRALKKPKSPGIRVPGK